MLHTFDIGALGGVVVSEAQIRQDRADRLQAFIERSGKTQRQIAEELGVDESYVSKMASGSINWVASRKYFAPLVRALGIKPEEVAEIKPDAVIEFAAPHPFSPAALGYRDIPKRTVEIPDELREAAEQYGHMPMFSELREHRWQYFMADMPRKRTPSDVEGWLQDFARLKEMGIEPPDAE